MTREEFYEKCSGDLYELLEFCREYGCEIMEEVLSDEEYDAAVDDMINDLVTVNHWHEIRDWLESLPSSYSGNFYERDINSYDYTEYDSDDTDRWYDDVLAWGIENGYIRDEQDDEPEEVIFEEENDNPAEDFMLILSVA